MSCGRCHIEAGLTLLLGIRLTAFELQSLKIPSTMLCDSMVGSLFQHKGISGIGTFDISKQKKISSVLLSTQRLAQIESQITVTLRTR